MLVVEVLEGGGHGLLVVAGALRVVREAAAREARCDLRQVVRRSTDGGDPGTRKSAVAVW